MSSVFNKEVIVMPLKGYGELSLHIFTKYLFPLSFIFILMSFLDSHVNLLIKKFKLF